MTCRNTAAQPGESTVVVMAILFLLLAFVPCTVAWCAGVDSPAASNDLTHIQKEAEQCVRPVDAVALYESFLAQPDLQADVRSQAEKQLEIWRDRERKGLRKAGKAWVTQEELSQRLTALIKGGLTFRKLGNKKFARTEMQKASDLDPTSATAEMWLGVFDVYDNEFLSAMRHFQEAARRDPKSAEPYSNAAVSGFRAGRTTRIAEDFRCAIERAGVGAGEGIAENMSIILALHSGEALDFSLAVFKSMPTVHLEALKEVYGNWLRDDSIDLDGIKGFTWFLPALPPGFEGPEFEAADVGRAVLPTRGGGTGFVIAPEFVITNCHVVQGADTVTIMNPAARDRKAAEEAGPRSGQGGDNGSDLPVEVLCRDSEVDLALLKCPGLNLPPLKMRSKVPRRGTELLSLGFPSFFKLGTSIKSTGGKVVSEPEPFEDLKSIFYHDATINPGNSGGPLVDDTATVIGVNVAGLREGAAVDNAMFMGIPVEEVWEFLASNGQDVPASESDSGTPMGWPDVDEIVSKSTVLVKTETKGRR